MQDCVNRVVIIGNGCAGAEGIIALRENGYQGSIDLLTDSKWPTYNPMLTTYYVAGKIEFDQLFPYGSNKEFTQKYNVSLHASSPVTALEAETRVAVTAEGREFGYDRCLIATGAAPFIPPTPGIHSEKVFTMRTVEDALRLRQAMKNNPKRALVVGASMVGVKIVELFHKAGMEVCLADMAPHLFPLAANAQCAEVLQERLVQQGVRFRFGAGLAGLEDFEGGIRASFAGTEEVEEADLAVICIGVRPNIGFVNREQVAVQNGILVNAQMETNVPGLYAAGDIAQGTNTLTGKPQIIGLWANARYQGRTAGRNMAGREDIFPGNLLHNITHFMGMDFVGIGDVACYDQMDIQQRGERYMQLFWKDGLLSGVNLIDRTEALGALKYSLAKGLKRERDASSTQTWPMIQDVLIREILTEVTQA